MTFDALRFAEETARTVFQAARASDRKTAEEPTHWQHPDRRSYAVCGRMTSRFGNPPTCPTCLIEKTLRDDEDDQTAVKLGLR